MFQKNAHRIYDTRAWRRTSKAYLASHPNCKRCGEPSKHVDHVKPLKDGGPALQWSNLQAMCRSCHAYKTHEDWRKHRSKGYDSDGFARDFK